MLRRSIAAVTICALIGSAETSQAQTAQDLVGSWRLASITSQQPGGVALVRASLSPLADDAGELFKKTSALGPMF